MVLLLSETSLKNDPKMNVYPETVTTSLENSRNCLRRIARHDDTEFSHQSILNVMERFVKTVNTMDETILVPCRLMDLKVGDEQDPCKQKLTHNNKSESNSVQKLLNSADLFQIYNMLHNVKDGLLWGQPTAVAASSGGEADSNLNCANTATITVVNNSSGKGHVRRPSTVSVTSTNSTSTISDTESEAGSSNENDSGIEEVQDAHYKTENMASEFRRHLDGLTRSLRQMTEAAHYLTWRYQHDIGGPA